MSPIFLGLAVVCWRVRQQPLSWANPRSPRQCGARGSRLWVRLSGLRIWFPSGCLIGVMNADSGAVGAAIGEGGQAGCGCGVQSAGHARAAVRSWTEPGLDIGDPFSLGAVQGLVRIRGFSCEGVDPLGDVNGKPWPGRRVDRGRPSPRVVPKDASALARTPAFVTSPTQSHTESNLAEDRYLGLKPADMDADAWRCESRGPLTWDTVKVFPSMIRKACS